MREKITSGGEGRREWGRNRKRRSCVGVGKRKKRRAKEGGGGDEAWGDESIRRHRANNSINH